MIARPLLLLAVLCLIGACTARKATLDDVAVPGITPLTVEQDAQIAE